MTIFTPSNQVKLTNVSVVRLKRGGKRFEVACYKNKILDWKNQITTDLDEVLQTDAIFTNVSKGQVAKKDELQKVFGAATRAQIISEILHNGDIQLGEKERSHKLEASLKDIATIVYEKCVNPATQKPYSVAIIEKAIGDAHYSVHPTKSSKQQALEVIKMLQEKAILPIERALMRLLVRLPLQAADEETIESLRSLFVTVESVAAKPDDAVVEVVGLCVPGAYRSITDQVAPFAARQACVVTLSLKTAAEGDL